ncbi:MULTISPECIES: ComEA family DNA-binding protein [Marinitoga]|uniref:ComEA family DNA-binding protein n=1 Tax=Marinitoga TaxID=160798 RepID=UPI0002FFBF02|nr:MULTISPECIES: helix-hairpin-helix domain-containing protein [Marinitoga]
MFRNSKTIFIISLIFFLTIFGGIFYIQTGNKRTEELNGEIKIDLYTASETQLTKIPGIGPKTAKKIIQYREKYGFSSVKDLMKIKGIGEKTYEKIRKYVYLSKSKIILKKKEKKNINNITYEELIEIPGIGPVSAGKIIEYRKYTKIRNEEDLKNIGLTNSQINKLKGVVEFE